jgi:aubergine
MSPETTFDKNGT